MTCLLLVSNSQWPSQQTKEITARLAYATNYTVAWYLYLEGCKPKSSLPSLLAPSEPWLLPSLCSTRPKRDKKEVVVL